MNMETITELMAIDDTSSVTSGQVLAFAKTVEV